MAALTSRNGLAGFSNYGATSVDLAAPGENINSAMPLGLVPGTATVSVGGSSYVAQALEFAGRTTLTGLTRPIHNCGIGNAGEFPAAVNGNIALIQRGTLNFSVKVANAAAAGAVAVIVYDNTTDPLSTGAWTLGEAGDWLPSVRVTKATGETILASLPTSGTVVNYADPALAYQYLDGTSMATPHVAGAVALAAQCYPSETLAQRMARIVNRTTAVTALSGRVKSGGRLNLRAIVDYDNDGLPDWWEADHFGTTATTGAADADADGFSNLAEFLAGTSPHDAASHLEFASFAAGAGAGGSGADVVVTFATQLDRAYQVEWTDDLLTGIWTGIGGAINGTGATSRTVVSRTGIASVKPSSR